MPPRVIVLGGGPGGVACALRLGELGAAVTLVDDGGGRAARGTLAKERLAALVAAGDAPAGAWFARFRAVRDAALAEAEAARRSRLAEHGVTLVEDRGEVVALTPAASVRAGGRTLAADRLVLAVGARPRRPDWCGPASPVVTADALYLSDGPPPARLVVLGGGYVAVGLAGLFRALGVEVTLVFAGHEPLDGFDEDLRAHVGAELVATGVRLRPQTRVSAVVAGTRRHAVETDAGVIAADRVVLAGDTSPIPNSARLGLDRFGLPLTPEGAVYVDTRYAARLPGVFAVGDGADHAGHGLAPGTFDYASIAAEEGRRLAEHLVGATPPPLDYDRVPVAAPGRPEVACLGFGEARARALGFDVLAAGGAGGDGRFVKLVAEPGGELLGCHLAGPGAGAAIGRVAAAIERAPTPAAAATALGAETAEPAAFTQELVARLEELG